MMKNKRYLFKHSGARHCLFYRRSRPYPDSNSQGRQASPKLSFSLLLLCPLICRYYEFAFHLIIYRSIENLFFPILFSVPAGVFLALITGLLSEKAGRIALPLIFTVYAFFFSAQTVYYSIFKTFFSFYSMQNGGQVMQFMDIIASAVLKNMFFIIIYLLPVVGCCVFYRFIAYGRQGRKYLVTAVAGICVFTFLYFLLLPVPGKNIGSAYELYHNYSSADRAVRKLGLVQNTILDVKNLMFGKKGSSLSGRVIPKATPHPKDPASSSGEDEIDTSPNILSIDFDAAAANAPNDDIRTLCEYFRNVTPTDKNQYTGMFEGYNMIFITAESFSPWCIDKELTPTLYKLANNGFVFDNFYNGLWGVSTSDGEYVNITGLVPKQGVWSMKLSGRQGNYMRTSYGRMFRENGYKTYAFHNNYYDYYGRDISHPNLGYDYYGLGKGLELEECWPESDLEMVEKSLPYYINDDLFHVYYMTVSGHMQYTFKGNMMATRHRDEVAGLPYSEEAKAYIACNIELDRALEYLIEQLEKAGKLEKTVIVMAADHYPYGLSEKAISELLGHKPEKTFELYKNSLIIWNSRMTQPVHVSKYGYAIDINPTVMNLFGMPYDSRLVMGRDLLSDSGQFIFLHSRSFITDICMYNNDTGEAVPLAGKSIPDGYIYDTTQEIYTKYIVSAAILDNDFYAYIKNYINTEH